MAQALISTDWPLLAWDGEAMLLRAVDPADAGRMHSFLLGLSLRSIRHRFWSGGPNLLRLTGELTGQDPNRRGVVACDRSGAIIGHAEYLLAEPTTAEVAVVVADRHQRRGLGPRLLAQLTSVAAASGVTRCVASVHPDNAPMLRVFSRHFGASIRQLGDECSAAFDLTPPARFDVA